MHEQAFHTCCRSGLSLQPGFQYNAVSPGLSEASLAQLASAHAGYQAPRDVPPEPTEQELRLFPVSLRHLPVDGLGSVVSQTKYVGREFQGRDGNPDTGRFGNYFSHILLASNEAQPYEGLLPIELWDAGHWRTKESPLPTLEPIPLLLPGGMDLDRALSILMADRARWVAPILNSVVAALRGGPRVVLVEEPGMRAVAWVALASFALPRALAEKLTFSTFEGRPQYVAMHLTLTTPGCDSSFPETELGNRVNVLDTVRTAPPTTMEPLLGRAIGVLTQMGAEALATVVREIVSDAATVDVPSLGAEYALRTGISDLVQDEGDVLEILALLRDWHAAGSGAGLLPKATRDLAGCRVASTPAILKGWSELHAQTRLRGHVDSEELTDIALEYLLAHIDAFSASQVLEQALPAAAEKATVRPTVVRLAEYLERITEPVPAERLVGRIAAGWRLALVGINDELDRLYAVSIADLLQHDAVARTFDEIRADPANREIVASVASALIARASGDAGVLSRLTSLASDPIIDQAITDALRMSNAFGFWAMGARIQLRCFPERRRSFVATLAALANTEAERVEIRGLYGPLGPQSAGEHSELIASYGLASRQAPKRDIAAAWQLVHTFSLVDQHSESDISTLIDTIAAADPHTKQHAGFVAWHAVDRRPRVGVGPRLEEWIAVLAYVASRPPEELPDPRYLELIGIAAELVLDEPDPAEHRVCFAQATQMIEGLDWVDACAGVIAHRKRDAADVAASLFMVWIAAPSHDDQSCALVLDQLLPAMSLSPRQREKVAKRLPDGFVEAWSEWEESHPPASSVTRMVGKLRRR